MPLTVETDKRNLDCNEVQQSQVSSSRPFLLSSLEPCVFEALKTSLLLLRVDGSVQFASRCVHDVLGISQEEIIGKHVRDFVLRDDYSRFEQCLIRLAEVQRIYDGRAAAAPNDAQAAASCVEQMQSVVPQGAPGDSASQNQLLVVPEFKKQIFTCRVRRMPSGDFGPSDPRRAARSVMANSPDTQTGTLRACGESTGEYFDAEVTAFARWCSADEEVGGVENAARILGDPHKQLCLFCVLKRCVSVSQHALPAAPAQSALFSAASFGETAAICGLQQGGPPFSSQLRPPSGTPQPQLVAPGESSSLIELLTSDAGSFAFETDPQSFYQLGFGAFDSCGPPLVDAYANTSLFDSVLNGVASDAPPVGPDCFYDPSGAVQLNQAFGDTLSGNATHTDLGNAPTPRCALDPLQNGSLRFVSEPADPARLKSPLAAPISRTPTPTTPGARLHGPLTLAPSQLAIVPASTGRTTPQHGRPSGGSESKKLRELLLKGSTGSPADTPADALSRSSRSCSVELPPESLHASSVATMRRGSLGTTACTDPVAPSPPVPRTALSTPTPTGLAPSKLESVSASGTGFGWQKDTKVGLRSGGQQSILIQLLNNDEPNVKRETEPPFNTNAGAVSSSAAVTSTTTSTSRVRAKRGSVKESFSVATPTVATGSLPAAARTSATKRTASLPLEELLDFDATSCSDTPISAAATATTTASTSTSANAKLAGIVQSVTHTTAYPLRGVQQPQFGAMTPRGPDQSTRPSGGQTELEKLLCDTSHTKSPDPPRHASGEPTTTTGPLNAPASTSAAQSQSKRAPRRTRNRSGANPNGQPQLATVQPQPADAAAALSKTVAKRRSTASTIGELLSAPSPVHASRYPPIGSVSQTSSIDQNEVANMLYDFSDTSEQMQNTRTFSDISAPLSVSSKRNSTAATLPKAAKLEIISNPDTGDDPDDSSNLACYTARSLADGDSACRPAPYGGALMTLLTSNSPPDQFAAPRSNAAPANTNPAWTPGTTYPPSNPGVITCEPTLATSAQRPISSQTNAALSQYVRNKRAFSATGLQPNATEPDSAVPPQFVASPSNTIYQQLGVSTPASVTVPTSDGTLEQRQPPPQPLASNSSVMYARVEPLGDLGPGLLFEQAQFTPASTTFALDVNGQPIAVSASGQPVLIGANGQPVPIGPYTPGPTAPGAPPRMPTLMRPPPPSYQMTTGAMQLAQPTHISDNYVSSTTSGFDVSTGLVSSTISPSQSLTTPTMRLTTPTSLQQTQASQPPPLQRQDVLITSYPQLSPFQLTPMPCRTPQAPLTPAIAQYPDPMARHFSPDSVISAAGASQPDDISLYLESLSTTELDMLINSVTVTLPPPSSPCTTAAPNMPLPVASNSSVQFVGTGATSFQPQYANVGTHNPHMQVQATYPMPPPSGALSTQMPRTSAPASQFYVPAQAQVSPAIQSGSAPATPLLARGAETPNVRLPADQSALLRAAIDQSGLPPSAFGITAPQPGPMPQPTGASPRTPLASPVRRSAPNLHVSLNVGSQMLVASQANQQHQVLVNEPSMSQPIGAGSDSQMVFTTLGNPLVQIMPPVSSGNLHMLGAPNNNGQSTLAVTNNPSMPADATHSAAHNQPDVLSGSKLAELMKATVPPNVTLPPGTHIQIPLQSTSTNTGVQAPASGTRNSQAAQQLAGASAPASQQKAGLIASQIVKEAELKQQQAAQSQAGLLQQLQARLKPQRPEQSELASVLASPPERPSQGPTGSSVTPSAFGSGAGPPPPSMFATARPPTGSVLASLINSPVHSPVITGAPPSAFVSSASAPVLACASNSATAVATALLQPVVNSRVPNAPTRTASQPQMQPTPPNRFASPISATPTQQSPVASSNTNANGPPQSAPASAQPSGSSQSELTDEIIETVEQLTQTHRSRLSRRSGSRSSVGEAKPADPQRPPKRHDSMLERLLAENN